MGGGAPIGGWEHSADLTIYLAPIHGALTPKLVKYPLYPREGVGHDTDRCIILSYNICPSHFSTAHYLLVSPLVHKLLDLVKIRTH